MEFHINSRINSWLSFACDIYASKVNMLWGGVTLAIYLNIKNLFAHPFHMSRLDQEPVMMEEDVPP